MKKTIFAFLTLSCVLAGLMTACENDGFDYRDEPRVRLRAPEKWALDTDSLEFSFITVPPEINIFEMEITAYIMGNPQDRDRVVNLAVDADKTTASSQHFDIPGTVTIPAGEFSNTFNITLKRTADLEERTVQLRVKVVDSDDFSSGVTEQSSLFLRWNDILIKPADWDDKLAEFFGSFSLTKYRFIRDVCKVQEFDTANLSWGALKSYNIQVKQALNEYNDGPNGPLTDENGQLVTFP